MTETLHTIPVLTARLPEARKELEKLAKKARRFGCPDIQVAVGESRVVKSHRKGWDGEMYVVKEHLTDLLIEGEAPRFGDHEFLAHIERTPNGNIVDTRPDIKDLDPAWRTTDGRCEHCKTSRRRTDIYIVRDTTNGTQLQVGRTCLRDYLGMDDPKAIAARFRFFREMRESEEGWGGGSVAWACSIEELLRLAAVSIRLFGWCSKGQAQNDESVTPTVSYVDLGLSARSKLDKGSLALYDQIQDAVGDEDTTVAQATMTWVRGANADSDYMHNLKVVLTDDMLYDPKRMGLVVSAVSGYLRSQEREVRRTKTFETDVQSTHIGEPGERIRGILVTKESGRVVGSNEWGETIMIKFRDDAGNIYSWFTSTGSGKQDGERAVIDGTVKRHNSYLGVKETQLTRVKVKEIAA
jgi:hypothetical protein